MMNTLEDLNNYLFSQLERLDNEELTAEELETEIKRSESISKVAEQIISNAQLSFKTMVHMDAYGYYDMPEKVRPPQMLETKGGKNGYKQIPEKRA